MELHGGSFRLVRNPTVADIVEALGSYEERGEEFLILERDNECFVQVSPPALEYRDKTGHYGIREHAYTPELARKVFVGYLEGREPAELYLDWETLEELEADTKPPWGIGESPRSGNNVLGAIVGILILLAGIGYLLYRTFG